MKVLPYSKQIKGLRNIIRKERDFGKKAKQLNTRVNSFTKRAKQVYGESTMNTVQELRQFVMENVDLTESSIKGNVHYVEKDPTDFDQESTYQLRNLDDVESLADELNDSGGSWSSSRVTYHDLMGSRARDWFEWESEMQTRGHTITKTWFFKNLSRDAAEYLVDNVRG